MQTIEATLEKVLFSNNSFAIFAVKNETFSVKGEVLMGNARSLIGKILKITGEFKKDNQGRNSFCMNSYSSADSANSFFFDLAGISKKTAENIIKSIPNWERAIETNPKSLLDVSGVGEKTLEKITQKYQEFKEVKALGDMLYPYGINNRQILLIHQKFNDQSIRVLTENPYRVTEIKGIGFKIADDIALKLGLSSDSDSRVIAAMSYVLQEQLTDDGHTYISIEQLCELVNTTLNDSSIHVDIDRIRSLIKEDDTDINRSVIRPVFVDENESLVSMFVLKSHEKTVFDTFLKYGKPGKKSIASESCLAEYLKRYQERKGKTLGEQQREALYLSNQNSQIMIVSGFAGTGKTTTSDAIIGFLCEQLSIEYEQVACCALSGIAANRIGVQSGYRSSTIHTLLGYAGYNQFIYNQDNKLPHKLIILDEASMVDVSLMKFLLDAINFFDGARLIMLGDPGQLEAVGYGQPFSDAINLLPILKVHLTKIYRQNDDQAITILADAVRNHKRFDFSKSYQDLKFVNFFDHSMTNAPDNAKKAHRKSVNEESILFIEKKVKGLRQKMIDVFGEPETEQQLMDCADKGLLTFAQIISPMKSGELGTVALTNMARKYWNIFSDKDSKDQNDFVRVGDKMIHLRNFDKSVAKQSDDLIEEISIKKRVYNGQLGVVTRILDDGSFIVYYPNERYVTQYTNNDIIMGVIDHAHALTVHKTQGSEFLFTILPVTFSHFRMLNSKLFYTGITRAKNYLLMVGDMTALDYASKTNDDRTRRTIMQLMSKALP